MSFCIFSHFSLLGFKFVWSPQEWVARLIHLSSFEQDAEMLFLPNIELFSK